VSKYRDEFVEDHQIIDHGRYNGQAPTLSDRDQRAIVWELKKKNPMLSLRSSKMEIEQTSLSHETIREYLHKYGIEAYKPAKRPPLDTRTKRLRYDFAKDYSGMPSSFWQSICFADECYVTCKTHYPKGYVWRTKGTRFDPKI